jgi:hypothetical protein
VPYKAYTSIDILTINFLYIIIWRNHKHLSFYFIHIHIKRFIHCWPCLIFSPKNAINHFLIYLNHLLSSKTRVIVGKKIHRVEELEWWTYDGSSTGQATTSESEIWIKPVAIFPDPFRRNGCLLALCEGYLKD